MNDLFAFAAHNTVVALVMTLFVFLLMRRRRDPPLAHVLWLLVLIKFVAAAGGLFRVAGDSTGRSAGWANTDHGESLATRGESG